MENNIPDIIIKKLQMAKPVLNDAENLTDRIMNNIDNKAYMPKSRMIYLVRAISSTAAIFLLGLFIHQQKATENPVTSNNGSINLEITIKIDSVENLKDIKTQAGMMKAYLCYMKQNSLENNQKTDFSQYLYN